VRANLVVVPLGADGSIDVRLDNTAHVIVDVVGSFTDGTAASAASAGTYVPLNPTRVVDTRSSLAFARLTAGGSGSVNPAAWYLDDALGVSQNIIMLDTDGWGYVTAYPTGTARCRWSATATPPLPARRAVHCRSRSWAPARRPTRLGRYARRGGCHGLLQPMAGDHPRG
jgi:hypothetical protein